MKQRGFTLIELMVVVSILSMLSSVILVSVNVARAKARDAVRVQQVRQINTAVQAYMLDHNGRPPTLHGLCTAEYGAASQNDPSSACLAISTQVAYYDAPANTQPTPWTSFKQDIAQYMPNVPDDPCGRNGCGSANQNDNLGYSYVTPAMLSYGCSQSQCGQSTDQLNQSYQLSASLESTASTTLNTNTNQSQGSGSTPTVTINMLGHGMTGNDAVVMSRSSVSGGNSTSVSWTSSGIWQGYPWPCTFHDSTGIFTGMNTYSLMTSGSLNSNPNPPYINDGYVYMSCAVNNPNSNGPTVNSYAVSVTFTN